jgi:hypothetical protein
VAKVFLRRNMVTKITLFIQSNNEVDDVFPCSFILAEKWFQSQLLVTGSLKYIEVIDFEYFLHIIFDRFTWDALHTGAGVIFILAAVVHFAIHWRWVVMVTKRSLGSLLSRLAVRRVQEKMLA